MCQQSLTLLALWLFESAASDEDTFQSDIDLAVVARTDASAERLAASLRDSLGPIARQHAVHRGVVPYSGRVVLSRSNDDAQMWTNLSRDATPLNEPAPEYLRQQLARTAATRRSPSPRSRDDATEKDRACKAPWASLSDNV